MVEHTLARLSRYRRFATRHKRRTNIPEAFLKFVCAVIRVNYLPRGLEMRCEQSLTYRLIGAVLASPFADLRIVA